MPRFDSGRRNFRWQEVMVARWRNSFILICWMKSRRWLEDQRVERLLMGVVRRPVRIVLDVFSPSSQIVVVVVQMDKEKDQVGEV